MSFDPHRLPLADLGLCCIGCRYPLAGLTQLACPECGLAIDMARYLPAGAMPRLCVEGRAVRPTARIMQLFEAHGIPCVVAADEGGLLPGMSIGGPLPAGGLLVARTHYFEAIDLLRRLKLGEPMPALPSRRPAVDWTCPACGDENPGSFDLCWQCGTDRPGTDASAPR